jgi:neurotransmitter:Na+ symporter, NSS family
MGNNNTSFASKAGAIFAVAGSAVGLGNVWRFPTEVGTNGGAAFIIIYVLCMLFFGVPVMISEIAIGRHGQKNVSHSFYTMSGNNRAWAYMGLLPIVAGVLVLSYYSVVAGWTLEYVAQAGVNGLADKTSAQYTADFGDFTSDPLRPIIWLGIVLVLTWVIVAMGVKRGIEQASKIMMPLLFVCIAILVVCSFSLPGAEKGLKFFFYPDFSKVTGATALSALGQTFFSLSVGICCMCTYGCYFRKDVDLMNDSLTVACIDTLVALMSGLIIFPAVYSVPGLSPDAGPSLVFITLPNVFNQVFAGTPVLSYAFTLFFYLLLVLAALTSSISMLEMSAAIFIRKFKMSRPLASAIVTLVCFVFGAACSLSFGVWQDVTVFGMTIFEFFDYLVAKFLMPIGAMLICVFVGWVVDVRVLKDELTNGGTIAQPLFAVYRLLVRYVAPVCIFLIFINELGLL